MTLSPLADLRVLSIEQFGAGPWGTMQLADLGADVIKVEDPATGGDVSRTVPPYQEGEDSLFFESFNRNKRSISLDLRSEGGREVLGDLVRCVDAVYSNLRGDQAERLGLTYAQLGPLNPRIVCCSLSGFGNSGPRAKQAGYDYVMQAMGAWMSLTGGPDEPPTKSGLSVVDFMGGYVSVLALLAGVWRARRDGEGCDCDVSLFETALAQLTYVGTWAASRGYAPPRLAESAHLSIVPFQAFEAADGWFVVACAKQKFWELLCDAIERPDLRDDPRFVDFAGRRDNREVLVAELRSVFRLRGVADWVETLEAAGVPVGRVNDVAGALADPQVEARDALVEYEHETLGLVRQPASALRLSGPRPPVRRGPRRGEHTEDVLGELCGYSAERVAELGTRGAFGPPSELSA
ncbi:MAG TPA: CoA transferase [Thermoleophilaceae bacterium]|jgi:crotonobetainyl-CoA:carnitine CoA-transferase CaiB-like acyl-CoA transferase|nr:CoA transferase [Thermoleophilaceae bacterium]